jgi:hypothetical protein
LNIRNVGGVLGNSVALGLGVLMMLQLHWMASSREKCPAAVGNNSYRRVAVQYYSGYKRDTWVLYIIGVGAASKKRPLSTPAKPSFQSPEEAAKTKHCTTGRFTPCVSS